jgi:hypothetical protein
LEECSFTTDLNPENDYKLETPLSCGEETGVRLKTGKAQKVSNQPSKSAWLNQVDGECNRFMYETALDWKLKKYPEEMEELLVDASNQSVEAKGKWINLLKFGEEWNM